MSVLKIQNRHGQNMALHVQNNIAPDDRVVFIQHDMTDSYECQVMSYITAAFYNFDYTVIALDTPHSMDPRNKSDGSFSEFSIEQHVTDFEDAIRWSRDKLHVRGAFTLAGHGLGAYSAMKLAATEMESWTQQVVACAPIFDGAQLHENMATLSDDFMASAQADGHLTFAMQEAEYTYSLEKFDAWKRNNLHAELPKIRQPVHFVLAGKDSLTRAEQAAPFIKTIPGATTPHLIREADHNFTKRINTFSRVMGIIMRQITPGPDEQSTDEPQLIL